MSEVADIRRGQVITTFGPGAIIATPNGESFMISANSLWVYENPKKHLVFEERLRRRLGVSELRLPPAIKEIREQNGRMYRGIDAIKSVRFPAWHHCRYCNKMQRVGSLAEMAQCTCPNAEENQSLIPVRFVAACPRGHIEDFPFQEWVHKGVNPGNHELYYQTGTSGSLGGIIINCKTCGVSRTMENALSQGTLSKVKLCSGNKPWLATEGGHEPCDEILIGAQRGASNLYFPQVISSIYIPERDAAVDPEVRKFFVQKKEILEGFFKSNPEIFDSLVETFIKGSNINTDINNAVEYIRTELNRSNYIPVDEDDFRFAEYDVLRSLGGIPDEDYSAKQISSTEYSSPIKEFFTKITLVEKLRETRVFAGFSRLQPGSSNSLVGTIRFANNSTEWLPADIVRGEGIFVELSYDKVSIWANKPEVRERANKILRNYTNSIGAKDYFTGNADPAQILLHTLAHILITEISQQCGYGNSSLRERIYFSRRHKMNGLLIYTASGDSEGSLGGLVRQGKPGRFEPIITSALEKARWCSSDPVCSSVGIQGPFGTKLAACHNCGILPETSCELFNNLLDRGLVVGTPDLPELGLFK